MGIFLDVDGCCGCFNLRTGTLIILWYRMIEFSATPWCKVHQLVFMNDHFSRAEIVLNLVDIAAMVLLFFLPSFIGIFGVYERKLFYLHLFVIISIFAVACRLLTAPLLVVVFLFADYLWPTMLQITIGWPVHGELLKTPGITMLMVAISCAFSQCILHWYFICVVHSYSSKIEEEREFLESQVMPQSPRLRQAY